MFLARTEMKQQKFVGNSRLSWKHAVTTSTAVDNSLDGVVSSDKVSCALPSESAVTVDVHAVSEHDALETNELPDLSSMCSKSETVSADNPVSVCELTDMPAQPSLKTTQRKLLLLSPVKHSSNTPEPSTSSCYISECAPEQVEMSLVPAIGKKLLLDPVDDPKKSSLPTSVVTETAALSERADVESESPSVSDCMVVDQGDSIELVTKMPQSPIVGKSSSRSSRLALLSKVPLPQLSRNPDDFVEFDDNDDASDDGNCPRTSANDHGVEQLMERLLQHARGSAHTRKPKTVEIR